VLAKYAVVDIFGRQFKVQPGQKVTASFSKESVGSQLTFSDVYMVSDENGKAHFGQPKVAEAQVTATVQSHMREKKILVFKYLRKNRSKKLNGHKQPMTVLTIDAIHVKGM